MLSLHLMTGLKLEEIFSGFRFFSRPSKQNLMGVVFCIENICSDLG